MKQKIELDSYPGIALSSREVEVLLYCAAGQTIQQTAESLSISYSTAKTHRENIRERFNLKGNFGIKHFADKHRNEFEKFLGIIEKIGSSTD